MKLKYYKVCRVRCKCCGDVLEHINHSKEENYHTMLYCSCGTVGLDPAAIMYRILGKNIDSFEDLSEEWIDDQNADGIEQGAKTVGSVGSSESAKLVGILNGDSHEKDRLTDKYMKYLPDFRVDLLSHLNALSEAWKDHEEKASGSRPDIPLAWSIDDAGMICLDRIWICPAREIDTARLMKEKPNLLVGDVTVSVPVRKGLLEIHIIKDYNKYEIRVIERRV